MSWLSAKNSSPWRERMNGRPTPGFHPFWIVNETKATGRPAGEREYATGYRLEPLRGKYGSGNCERITSSHSQID
jgi:hypothetical protein